MNTSKKAPGAGTPSIVARLSGAVAVGALLLSGCGGGGNSPLNDTGTNPTPTPTIDLAQTEPGAIAVVDSGVAFTESQEVPKDSDHILISPGIAVRATKTGTASQFLNDGIATGPAPGEQLTAVELAPATDVKAPEGTTELTVTAGDGQAVSIMLGGPQTIVISSPAGAKSELRADCDGVRQTLDLATGKRTSSVASGFYVGKSRVNLGESYRKTEKVKLSNNLGTDSMDATFNVDSAIRSPYLADFGWAPDDQVWVQVTLSNVALGHSVEGWGAGVPDRDASKVSLTATGGAECTYQKDKAGLDFWWNGGDSKVVFAAPADALSYKFSFAPGFTTVPNATSTPLVMWPAVEVQVGFEAQA